MASLREDQYKMVFRLVKIYLNLLSLRIVQVFSWQSDSEKAFDSLNRSFLFKVLEKFNFGSYFLQWIKTFYSNISSCVLNNGFTTDLFPVRGVVWQGDPLSPLLFMLALETLLKLVCQIRQDNGIRGILVEEEEIKWTLFAFDMTCLLRDMASPYRLVVTLQLFSKFSNLQVNSKKTEIFAIGRHFLDQSNFPHKIRTSIKILTILTITYVQGWNQSLSQFLNLSGIY